MHYVTAKSILTSGNGTGMNVYRGCTHGCIYCDSRSACYHPPMPFEDIEVKQNAVALLEKALAGKRKKIMIGTGSMCDPYMPIESELQITRKCLEVIDRYGFGVTVHTKSDLVLRDFDLLQQINRHTKAVLQMTLTCADHTLSRKIEPNVCTSRRRFEVLMEAKHAGIPTVVWLCPFLPYITDTRENMNTLVDWCIEAGVQGIIQFGIGLTLRDGNRGYFYNQLNRNFPGLTQTYIRQYGDNYEIGCPNGDELYDLMAAKCKAAGIMYKPDDVFAYLHQFESKDEQLSLF